MRILLAGCDPVSALMLRTALMQWGHAVEASGDPGEWVRAIEGPEPPSTVLLDWTVAREDGLRFCRRVRGRLEPPYIFLMLLGDDQAREAVLRAWEAGADDFFPRPFDLLELKFRLRAARRVLDVHDSLLRSREALLQQAATDSLTGIWNRGAIVGILERELERARRARAPLGLLVADLDGFKGINDLHGHLVGDQVLREASTRMSRALRPYDALGRFGGEEFLAVLPGCDVSAAQIAAERLRRALESQPVATTAGAIATTVSIGVASTEADPHESAFELVRRADEALYQAKRGGRNRVEIALSPAPA